MRSHPGYSRSFSKGVAIALMALACLPVAALAVDEDKVRYIGGTPEHYPLNARPVIFGEKAPKFEGRFDPGTGSAFTFDGGRWGTLSIPYEAISSVDYGWKLRPRRDITLAFGSFPLDALPIHMGDVHRIWIPWDPFEQFTNKVHDLLTLAYRDQAGKEQAVVSGGRTR